MVKGRLAYFSPECSAIIPLLTEYFPYVEPFGYDNSPNEGTVKFSAKLGKFPHFPKIGGRGEESNHGMLKLHHTANCS